MAPRGTPTEIVARLNSAIVKVVNGPEVRSRFEAIGINARTSINPVAFGLPPLLGDAIEIVVDAEFQRNP